MEYIVIFSLWIISLIGVWIFSKKRCDKKNINLELKAISLKNIIEDAIKDKLIDPSEADNIRDAVLDLEEIILK